MKIKIGNIEIDATDFDDSVTVLEKYAIEEEIPPTYLRTEPPQFKIVPGLVIAVEDIRDELRKKSIDQLTPDFVSSLQSKFPHLTKSEISFVWILQQREVKGRGVISLEKQYINNLLRGPRKEPATDAETKYINKVLATLQNINADAPSAIRDKFITAKNLKEAVENYEEQIGKNFDLLQDRFEKEGPIVAELSKYPPVGAEKFNVEIATFQFSVVFSSTIGILNIFDEMKVTKNIPFIYLKYKGKDYYKTLIPFSELVRVFLKKSQSELEDGIHFWVFSVADDMTVSKHYSVENLYSKCLWISTLEGDNLVTVDFIKQEGVTSDIIIDRILSLVGDRLRYVKEEIEKHFKQVSVSGTFRVPNFFINRVVFADMIMMDNNVSYFLFVDETKETATKKERFPVHYLPNQQGTIGSSLKLLITQETGDVPSLKIRISKAQTIPQIDSTIRVVRSLLAYYDAKKRDVEKIYKRYIPDFTIAEKAVAKKKKDDRKSGRRRVQLKAADADLFGANYPALCQLKKQPYLITKKEYDTGKITRDGVTFTLPGNKVMEYGGYYDDEGTYHEGKYYACEPREIDDTDREEGYVYPGLSKIRPKGTEYFQKYMGVPCCFKENQYDKKGAILRRYEEQKRKGVLPSIVSKRSVLESKPAEYTEYENPLGYALAPTKLAPRGRLAELPILLSTEMEDEVEKIERVKQKILPYVRYGVLISPDSFFHCLELAFNDAYSDLSVAKRAERVMKVRKTISESNLSYGKQELYGMTDDEIKQALSDPTTYIAPEKYISLAALHYRCNIFMYIVNSEYPAGNILLPSYSQAYLSRNFDETKKTVIITSYQSSEESKYPYQCELVVRIEKRARGEEYIRTFDVDDILVQLSRKFFYDSYDVFIVSREGYSQYVPTF